MPSVGSGVINVITAELIFVKFVTTNCFTSHPIKSGSEYPFG
jgi:hypothetical protein